MRDAGVLVKNLIARLEPSAHGSGYVWNGIITDQERAALLKLVDLADESRPNPVPSAPAVIPKLAIDKSSLEAKVDDGVMICLDFGTAFSKAAAVNFDDDLLEIAMGKQAGETSNLPFQVHSSIYFSDERMWFGPQAVERALDENDFNRRMFDSPKQEMSQGDLGNLRKQLIATDINPTSWKFSKADLIQLYLAYLMNLAKRQLGDLGLRDIPKLRFARPCWDDERADQAKLIFREMLSKALVIGDTLSGQWASGISLGAARDLLDRIDLIRGFRDDFIDGDVLEATAAASGALKARSLDALFLVVDIGAGTCDMGLFFVVRGVRIAELSGTTRVLRQAGNRIDDIVRDALLDAAHVGAGSDEKERILYGLRGDRTREIKAQLFRDGHVSPTLANDAIASLSASEFCNRADVIAFVERFQKEMVTCLAAPKEGTYDRFRSKVQVVLTGGGSGLPMIREIFSRPIDVPGHGLISFEIRDATPEWLADYPNYIPIFPQLAVALGGAQYDLPASAARVSDIVPPPPGRRYIPTTYRG